MAMSSFSKQELAKLLSGAINTEFDTPAMLLKRAMDTDPDVSSEASAREIPVAELLDTYKHRNEWMKLQSKDMNGLQQLVELLDRAAPSSTWRIISISDRSGQIGAVFHCSQTGELGIVCLSGISRHVR